MYTVFKETLAIYGKISVDFIVCRSMLKKMYHLTNLLALMQNINLLIAYLFFALGFCVLLAALLTLVATFWRKLLKNVEEVSPNAEFQLSKECNFTDQDRELSPREQLDKLITEKKMNLHN